MKKVVILFGNRLNSGLYEVCKYYLFFFVNMIEEIEYVLWGMEIECNYWILVMEV